MAHKSDIALSRTGLKYKTLIDETLKSVPGLWDGDELDHASLAESLRKNDPEVVGALLQNSDLKKKFFTDVAGALVFEKDQFRAFMEKNKLNSSLTTYKNHIGLLQGKKLLKDNETVALNFPFKDCVLQGGQRTEKDEDHYYVYKKDNHKLKKGKRNEMLFNSFIAPDEIDQLLSPKALVNWKKYSPKREAVPNAIKRTSNGEIGENLIIKGNNLLALHSIHPQFAGKVKLIYIDPPYNTKNDGFKYNDSFRHSTWLTFMKNRLEIARKFMREDGAILVQCDDHEQAYLTVLMDDIFGRNNFVQSITVKMSETSGLKMQHRDHKIIKVKETILFYAKNKRQMRISDENYPRDFDVCAKDLYKQYNKIIENFESPHDKWKCRPLRDDEKNMEFLASNNHRIFRLGVTNKKGVVKSGEFSELDDKFYINGEEVLWLKKRFFEGRAFRYVGDIWSDIKTTGIAKEGGFKFKNGKKPEKLIQRIIKIVTEKDDIVMDFFLGSGTTAAVAHKMRRRYIGIEQMDYIKGVTARLQGVIKGEQGGISMSENWRGGGGFCLLRAC